MGVQINKGTPGAGKITGQDGNSALVMQGVATADIALGAVKELRQLKDAEALGLTKAYDATNNVRVWYNIKEFYRMLTKLGVSGVPLWIMLVDNTLDVDDACNVTMEMMVDPEEEYAKKLIVETEGAVRLLGVVLNPDTGYTSTILDGLDADVMAAIPKAQALADWAWDTDRPISVILEGREFDGTAAAAQDLRAITDVEAEDVLTTILQDWSYADGLDTLGKLHAAVGTVLGCAAAIRVNQHIGEVQTMNIQDVGRDAFVIPGISSHEQWKEIEADAETFKTKGYIMGEKYAGYNGVYLNEDYTCTPYIEDADGVLNVHNLNLSRARGKIKRALRNAYLPKVKSVQLIDAATGFLTEGGVATFNKIGDDVFLDMQRAGEISEGKAYTNPESDLLTPPRILEVDWSFSPTTTVGKIQGNLNIKRTL
ncbi:MAG: DUF2586 family protein [Imperialibacter sp.]|uniref:DUF2586 family protein n=1 Tax=Imperialibacter sp. TaxID=2038411 RepID=UPI0032EBF171